MRCLDKAWEVCSAQQEVCLRQGRHSQGEDQNTRREVTPWGMKDKKETKVEISNETDMI